MIALDVKTLGQKKTDALDLMKPLSKYLTSHQDGSQKLKQHQEHLNSIQQHRNEMRNLQDRSEGSRDLCLKYAAEMEHLSAHFPINSGTNRVQLTFSWYDSFSGTKVSQGNCFYEQASALFNAAVIEHQLGASQNRQSDEGINASIKHFQTAAGLFQYIKDRISPKITEKITSDITGEALDCLVNLSVANAQQCVVEKAFKKRMKPEAVSKIAHDTARQFSVVYSQMTSGSLKTVFGKAWESYVNFARMYFEAFSVHQLAVADREEDEVGRELARLERAINIVNTALQFKVSDNLSKSLKAFEQTLVTQYNTAQVDNQKVYHYKVPKFEDLPEVQGKKMANAVIIEDLIKYSNVADMFSDLYPIPVIEAAKQFLESVRSKEDAAFKNAREHRDQLKTHLASMGLPGSILAVDSKSGFPQEVHTKIQAINKLGGVVGLQEERVLLNQLADITRELCNSIKRTLEKEAADDQSCREQYGNRWARLPSSSLTQGMYKALNDHYSKVNIASNADKLIDNKIAKWKDGFAHFDKTPSELNSLLPNLTSNVSVQQVVTDLKKFYDQLEVLFGQEIQIEEDVRGKTADIAAVQEYLLKEQSRVDAAVQEKLAEADREIQRIAPLLAEEDKLMQQITGANNVFVQSKNQSNVLQEREAVIQSVYDSINRYNEVMANIKEGKTFYQAMQDILEKLKQKAEDFAFARETNKQDIIENLSRQPVSPSYIMPQQQPQQQSQPQYQQPQQQQQQHSRQLPHAPQQQQQRQPQYGQPPQYQQPQQQQPPYPQQQQPYYNPQQPPQYQQQQPPNNNYRYQ